MPLVAVAHENFTNQIVTTSIGLVTVSKGTNQTAELIELYPILILVRAVYIINTIVQVYHIVDDT